MKNHPFPLRPFLFQNWEICLWNKQSNQSNFVKQHIHVGPFYLKACNATYEQWNMLLWCVKQEVAAAEFSVVIL